MSKKPTPDPKLRGVIDGNCKDCQAPHVRWYNHLARAYYCERCANHLNIHCEFSAMQRWGHRLLTYDKKPDYVLKFEELSGYHLREEAHTLTWKMSWAHEHNNFDYTEVTICEMALQDANACTSCLKHFIESIDNMVGRDRHEEEKRQPLVAKKGPAAYHRTHWEVLDAVKKDGFYAKMVRCAKKANEEYLNQQKEEKDG